MDVGDGHREESSQYSAERVKEGERLQDDLHGSERLQANRHHMCRGTYKERFYIRPDRPAGGEDGKAMRSSQCGLSSHRSRTDPGAVPGPASTAVSSVG